MRLWVAPRGPHGARRASHAPTFCPNPKLVVEAAAPKPGAGAATNGLAGGFAANEFGVVAGAPNAPPPPKLGLGCGAPNPPGAPNCAGAAAPNGDAPNMARLILRSRLITPAHPPRETADSAASFLGAARALSRCPLA